MEDQALQAPGYFHVPPGWTLVNECHPSQIDYNAADWAVDTMPVPDIHSTTCLIGQAAVVYGVRVNPPPTTNDRQLVLFDKRRSNVIIRYATRRVWTRPAAPNWPTVQYRFPTLYPSLRLAPLPRWLQPRWPENPWDPLTPPLRPTWVAPKPFNLPWKVADPREYGPEDRDGDNGPPPVGRPRYVVRPIVIFRPRPGRQPKPEPNPGTPPPSRPPGYFTVLDPETIPRGGRSGYGSHGRRRPRGKEKERKLRGKFAKAVAIVMGAFGQFTEALDFVDVVYRSLPAHRQEKGNVKVEKKLKAIYAHFEEVDTETFVRNFLKNQIEDFIYSLRGRADAYRYQAVGSGGLNPMDGLRSTPFAKAFHEGFAKWAKERGYTPQSVTDYSDAAVDYVFELVSPSWAG